MTLYSPKPTYSESEKRLLALLGKLLLEHMYPGEAVSNIDVDKVVLSDREADELAQIVGDLVDSREFREASYFVEGLSRSTENTFDLREIYLSARKRRGRSRALSSTHWAQFQARLGVNSPAWRPAEPMSIEYFK